MRNNIILPACAIFAGAAGFVLRMWQWNNTYDPLEERFIAQGIGSWMPFLLMAVVAAAFLLVSFKCAPKKVKFPLTCGDPLYMTLMAAGGFLFFGAGILGMLEGMTQLQLWRSGLFPMVASYPIALLLCAGLCLVSGLCVLVMGKYSYRPEAGKSASLFAVLPPFALLIWLFATHQAHATDPIFMRYGIYLSAAVMLTLAHYDAAGFYHSQRHKRRFLFCTLTGTTLAIAAMADGLSMFQMAIAAACVVTALGHTYALLSPETES